MKEEEFIEKRLKMEPIYNKKEFKATALKKTPLYPVYFPDKLLTLSKTFNNKINELFSYEVIYLLPNKENIQTIRKIIEFRLCINYNHILYCSNCFNPYNFKVTFLYVCHVCHHIYMLSGKYNSRNSYEKAFKFFKL